MARDRGFALATTMMVLALISVLGAMAIRSATLEVQISAHDRDARAALYVAEAALDEARYYVSRGWGKISHTVSGTILDPLPLTLDTGPPTFVTWYDDLYAGFTLVDSDGRQFPVVGNAGSTISVTTGGVMTPPQDPGRYLLIRNIPNTPLPIWDNGSRTLTIEDNAWATATAFSGASWENWQLWDSAGLVFRVLPSSASGSTVRLKLDGTAPPTGPFVLGINPWLAELAGGTAPLGDADSTSPDIWDRVFLDDAGNELGRAEVKATVLGEPGSFTLKAVGGVGSRRQTVQLTVFRAGNPTQGTGDWMIVDG